MRIVNNLIAMNATRMSGINQLGTEKSIEKLSSGQLVIHKMLCPCCRRQRGLWLKLAKLPKELGCSPFKLQMVIIL